MRRVATKPNTSHGGTRQAKGQIVMGIAGDSNVKSPLPSIGPKTLHGSAYRVGETSVDAKGGNGKGSATLVPNFRSISPSIFNIDLN